MIKKEISKIKPFDKLEQEHLADALKWIDSGVEVCRIEKPAMPPKHLVSYFVLADENYVLLVDHKNAKLWLPTGAMLSRVSIQKILSNARHWKSYKSKLNLFLTIP
jgi:hypothetical protein